jgi:hypothetical protein
MPGPSNPSATASLRTIAMSLSGVNAFLCFVLMTLTEPDRSAGIWFLFVPFLAMLTFFIMFWSVRLTSLLLLSAAVAHVLAMVLTIHDAFLHGASFSEGLESIAILIVPVLLSWSVALCVLKSYRLQRIPQTLVISEGS